MRAFSCLLCLLISQVGCSGSKNGDPVKPGTKPKEDEKKSVQLKPRSILKCDLPVTAVAIAANGKTLIAYGQAKEEQGIFQLWDLTGPKKLHEQNIGRTMSGRSPFAITRDSKQ